MTSRAQFIQGASFVTLKMTAKVLNFAPRMGENDQDLYVRHKNGRGYPNTKREVKAMTPDERDAIAAVIVNNLNRAFATTTGEE